MRGQRAWLLRWYLAAGAITFLTEYPILDLPHLAWSAGVLLVVGSILLSELHNWIAARWRLTPAGRTALVAALLIVPFLAASAQIVGWRVPHYVVRDDATGLPVVSPLVRLDTVRYADDLWVPPTVREELTSLLDMLHQITSPGEPIFVYPVSPLIYVLADRPNPTRLEHVYPGTVSRAELMRLVDDLERAQVNTVVVSAYAYLDDRLQDENAIVKGYLAAHFQESWRFAAYTILRRVRA
jgi:hypothetical protein